MNTLRSVNDLLPFPTILPTEELVDGIALPQPSYCRSECKDRMCAKIPVPTQGRVVLTCPHGFTVVGVAVEGAEFRINGVLCVAESTASPEFKKAWRSHKITPAEIDQICSRLPIAVRSHRAAIRRAGEDEVAGLHEIKALSAAILRIVEDIIWSQDGVSMSEKIGNSTQWHRELYSATRLLDQVLQHTDVSVNPESASFGQRAPIHVYKTAHAIARLYGARAGRRGITIQMGGSSHEEPMLFRSFPLCLLSLIDNAVKHADPNTVIHVDVTDSYGGNVLIEVRSVGPLVAQSERSHIFERGYRGLNASQPGSGLGLHVATVVAQANGCTLAYSASPYTSSTTYGQNVFSIKVVRPVIKFGGEPGIGGPS